MNGITLIMGGLRDLFLSFNNQLQTQDNKNNVSTCEVSLPTENSPRTPMGSPDCLCERGENMYQGFSGNAIALQTLTIKAF